MALLDRADPGMTDTPPERDSAADDPEGQNVARNESMEQADAANGEADATADADLKTALDETAGHQNPERAAH